MKNIVIVGNSPEAVHFIEALRESDKESRIVLLSEENHLSYRIDLLPDFIEGALSKDKISYRGAEFFQQNNVEIQLGKTISRINFNKNRISVEAPQDESAPKTEEAKPNKVQLDYDALLLANSAGVEFPAIEGVKKEGVFGLRTLEEAEKILNFISLADTACVIGGGTIALKLSLALKNKKLEVKLITQQEYILSKLLDREASEFFQNKIKEAGIELINSKSVSEVIGNGDVKAVRLDSGKVIACQLVIFTDGVSPNIQSVKDSEIKLKKGILVDNTLKTSLSNVYAAGSICQLEDEDLNRLDINQLYSRSVAQGKIAGKNIAGENIQYQQAVSMNSLEFLGLSAVSIGDLHQKTNQEILVRVLPDNKGYKKLVIEGNNLAGAILVGDTKQAGDLFILIEQKKDISSFKDKLLNDDFSPTT
ncbi:MAG TPA: FAD-dependent oxidoreductase [Candidatus Omnitrophota bacterium]|nr:FAD-dependent oxidoreductase [Candidatus Omnitrophota bacterium]